MIFFPNFGSGFMAKYRNIGLWFLLSLLVFAITPKVFFHGFHAHDHEIEHVDLDCHKQHFETRHTHCPLLNQVLPQFNAHAEILHEPYIKQLICYRFSVKDHLKFTIHFLFGLKAPPALVF